MRRILFIVFIFSVLGLKAQNNAFILVDVSGSINDQSIILQSRQILNSLLAGGFSMTSYPDWNQVNIADPALRNILNGNNQSLLNNGSVVCLMPFGNRDRYRQYNLLKITYFPDELRSFLATYYPVVFTDNYTYNQIAQAYTALLAEQQNIYSYYIISLSDDLGDQENTSSKNLFSTEERDLINAWNNPLYSQVVSVGSLQSQNFYISFKKVRLLKKRNGEDVSKPEIILLNYAGGKAGHELEVAGNSITLNWSCSGCLQDQEYLVTFSSTDGNAANNIRKQVQSTSYTTSLSKGKYRITVSSEDCIPGITYINVTGGGGGFPWLLLIFIAAIAGGYFLWKSHQNKLVRRNLSHAEFNDISEPMVMKPPRKEEEDSELF